MFYLLFNTVIVAILLMYHAVNMLNIILCIYLVTMINQIIGLILYREVNRK